MVSEKALFIIERNLKEDLSLEGIAKGCNVSRFHLAHAFGETTGFGVMEYIRSRRLSVAASALASGAGDILEVALDAGYGSHEAFSRAFKSRFGSTPEAVRKSGSVDHLPLVTAMPYAPVISPPLSAPLIRELDEWIVVGLQEHVRYDRTQSIAGQWMRFMSGPYQAIDHKLPEPPVGIGFGGGDDGIAYMCAALVSKPDRHPQGCVKRIVPPAIYAVFNHQANIALIRQTYQKIWNDWLPDPGRMPADGPSIERHNDGFDPRTGDGGVTIWIPLQR